MLFSLILCGSLRSDSAPGISRRRGEADATEMGSTEAGSTDGGSTDAGATEEGVTEVSSTKEDANDVGATETGATETGATETGVAEMDFAEVGANEMDSSEVGTNEMDSAEVSATETDSAGAGDTEADTTGVDADTVSLSETADDTDIHDRPSGGCAAESSFGLAGEISSGEPELPKGLGHGSTWSSSPWFDSSGTVIGGVYITNGCTVVST